ncbi:MAG: HPr(Ser) kinase/phosphatase [Pyrinomonadaceae bacterium]|nr:HPr(Ser) kinase/phosphatase [Pyrinomonadaceae bacterium]
MSQTQTRDHGAVSVSEFRAQAPARLQLRFLAGECDAPRRQLTSARIQKLGLALAGFKHYIHPGRLQLVGQSEVQYLNQLATDARREAIRNLDFARIACVLVTKNLVPPAEFIEEADECGLPLLQTPLVSSEAITVVTETLQHALAPRETRHGVLMDVYGLGVLLEGCSGIGKSECALDLIAQRGHRLVADDAVEVRRIAHDALLGSAPELLREHMEIRGLGIINVRDLFGVSAVSSPKTIELVIQLEAWSETLDVERLGIDKRQVEILGVEVPRVLLPVSPGRNLSTLVETAVRVHLLRAHGVDAAINFVRRHGELLRAKEEIKESSVDELTAAQNANQVSEA